MSEDFQRIAALAVAAIAAVTLIARFIARRKHPGCGGDCGAVSPEVKRLQSRLKR